MTKGEILVCGLLIIGVLFLALDYWFNGPDTLLLDIGEHYHPLQEHEHEQTTKFYTEFPHHHMIELDHTGQEILDTDRIDPRVQVGLDDS